MKKFYFKSLFLLGFLFVAFFQNKSLAGGATNYTLGTSVTLSSSVGCVASSYTFTQTTANSNDAKISVGAAVSITFPAGVNVATATTAGSSFGGLGITSWTISGQTITFTAPAAVGKNASFSVVINNVTNGASISANATLSIVNNSGGTSSSSTLITTSACVAALPNDNCSGTNGTPISLTPPAAGSSTCTTTSGTTYGASLSSQTVCSGNADDDVWYTFNATNTNHQVTVDGIAGFNTVVQVLSGACGSLTSLSCQNATGDDGIETANLTGLTVGTSYKIRIYHNGAGAGVSGAGSFTVCITSTNPVAGTCTGIGTTGNQGLPGTPLTLPYTSGAQNTLGDGNEITSTNVTNICGSSLYFGGDDNVIIFTPGASSGNSAINLTSTGSYVGMALYQGCPTAGGTCVASSQSSAGNQSIGCAPLLAGQIYYLLIDSWPSPQGNPYNVTIGAPTGGIPLGTTCVNNQPMTLPYTATGQSTLCYGNEITNSTAGVGTTSYLSGEDKVYTFTTTGPECIAINITNASTSYIGWHVFSGCPGAGGTLVGRAEYATAGALSGSVTVGGAGTYYLVIDTYASPSYVNYDLEVLSLGTGPSNDVCSGATAIALGATVGGDNNCTGSTGEPAAPSCWVAGTMNTVWYSAVAPASGKLNINVTAGSLVDPQVAVYSGSCPTPTLVTSACNEDALSCGGSTTEDAQLKLTGLTSGTTYLIRIDGYNNTTGTFSVYVNDGNVALPLIPGQDCGDPNPVCLSTVSVSNPGYSGYGNVCDLPSTYCLYSAERHVVWYRVKISTASASGATFGFNIVPNDFVQASESETDYDFGVWRIGQSGGVLGTDYYDCSQIAAGTAPPVACNYSGLGVTGVAGATGTGPGSGAWGTPSACPQCTGGYNPNTTYDWAYEPLIGTEPGETYLIAVSNFSASTSGFRMNFLGTATIDYEDATDLQSAGLTWSGGDATTPTAWNDVDNWGGCSVPSCSINSYIQNFSSQPTILTSQVYSTKDIVIGPGATLTLNAGATLEICGNFINNGTVNCDPTSTIIFKGSAAGVNQTISGSFTGANRLGNVIVYKATGTGKVIAGSDIEIGGSFSTANATSIFDFNSKNIYLHKHFNNFAGATTFTNAAGVLYGGTLRFVGTGSQIYAQGSSQLNLCNVIVDNTAAAGSGVTLTGSIPLVSTSLGNVAAQSGTDMFISSNNTLQLVTGTITTGASTTPANFTGNKVHLLNTTAGAVNSGNATSYVDGNLRRYHSTGALGVFEWPLGQATTTGYNRASLAFTSCSTAGFIDSRFQKSAWDTAYTAVLGTEQCGTLYDMKSFNNGFWTFIPSTAGTYGYNATLYPLNVTNIIGSVFTIIKRPHDVLNGSSWAYNGTCSAGSTSSTVIRTGMTNFSFMAVDQGIVSTPIELLYFRGKSEGSVNKLEWETVSERDNDFFHLERSKDGVNFEFLLEKDGAGNSTNNIYYSDYDLEPFRGVTYYRLKQVDFNGDFTYTDVIALSNNLSSITMSSLFPNPADESTSFNFFTPTKGDISIKVFDQAGRVVINIDQKLNQGNTKLLIDSKELASGIYNIEVSFDKDKFKQTDKLIKK